MVKRYWSSHASWNCRVDSQSWLYFQSSAHEYNDQIRYRSLKMWSARACACLIVEILFLVQSESFQQPCWLLQNREYYTLHLFAPISSCRVYLISKNGIYVPFSNTLFNFVKVAKWPTLFIVCSFNLIACIATTRSRYYSTVAVTEII